MFKFKHYLNRPVASGNISNYFVNVRSVKQESEGIIILLTDIGSRKKEQKL